MKVLVTGGSGFIGSHLVNALVGVRKDDVTVIDWRHPDTARLAAGGKRGITWTNVNYIQRALQHVMPVLTQQFDEIYHLAGRPGVQGSWNELSDYLDQNVAVTQLLLDHARRYPPRRFVYASSSSIYNVRSPYGVSKIAGEGLCEVYRREFGVPVTALRYFTVYGPRQRPDMAFSRFFWKLTHGHPITLYDGQMRDFTYVNDIVKATLQMDMPVADVGYGQPIAVEAAFEEILKVTGLKPVSVKREARRFGDAVQTCATSPTVPCSVELSEGLRRQWHDYTTS